MADITVTKGKVRPLPLALSRNYIAGGSGSIGSPVYLDSAGKAVVADASLLATSLVVGIVVAVGNEGKTDFVAGDPLSVCYSGPITGFSGMTPGQNMWLSDTLGRIADAAGTFATLVGVSIAPDIFMVRPQMPSLSTAAAATVLAPGIVELATDAETVAVTDAQRAVTPHGLGASLAKLFIISFTGHNNVGACTATGVAVGDVLFSVTGLTTVGDASSSFEAVVTVADQIQQSAVGDLSAKNFMALVYHPS
jgi:hypothetical protein